jgi:hypothetical protein
MCVGAEGRALYAGTKKEEGLYMQDSYRQPPCSPGDTIRVIYGDQEVTGTVTGYRDQPGFGEHLLHFRVDGEQGDRFVGKMVRVEKVPF